MSSANSNLITRRSILQALAALPLVTLPALPEITQEAPAVEAPASTETLSVVEAHYSRLLDFTVELADFQAYLLGITRFGKPVDPIELLDRWGAATRIGDSLTQFLLNDFDDSLQVLCGGSERYHAILGEWEEMRRVDG